MSSNKHVSSSPAKGSKSLNFSVYGLHCFSFFALCLFFSYIEYPPDTMRIHLGMRNTKNSTVVNTANKMAAPISSLDTPTGLYIQALSFSSLSIVSDMSIEPSYVPRPLSTELFQSLDRSHLSHSVPSAAYHLRAHSAPQ